MIEWPSRIDEEILVDILSLQGLIEKILHKKIEETVNTYNSLAVFFNPDIISMTKLLEEVKKIRHTEQTSGTHKGNVWQIPVCYDPCFGIDLHVISKDKDLAIEEIIKLHTENSYTVYFTGFLPGFLYLGGLSEKLVVPRRETPRSKVIRGSVAIGSSQTGIYPQDSPGGWNIIGNSPVPLFAVQENPPIRIKAGDKIKFTPISKTEYEALSRRIKAGAFELKPQGTWVPSGF